MGGVRVRVVPVRGDAPRGRVVRLPAGTGGFRHGGSCGACGACVSRRRGWRPLRHGGAGRAGRGGVAAAPARWCLACRDGWLPHRRVVRAGAAGGRTGAVPCTPVRADPYRRVVPIRPARADPHRVMPCPPEAGGFRTGGSCSRCRYDWPSSDTVVRAAKPHRHGDAVPAGSGRLPHRRVVRAGAAGGRTGAVPCTPVRADPYRRVVPIRSARADPHRVMPCPPEPGGSRTGGSCSCRCGWRPYRRCAVHTGTGGPVPTGGADQAGAGGPAPGGAGVPDAAGPPGEGQAGENKWSLMRRAAPMTPAVGPSSPRTMGRLPVARGSEPR